MRRSLALAAVLAAACTAGREPRRIEVGAVTCDYCHMTVAREQHAAQLVPARGAVRVFDEPGCLLRFVAASPAGPDAAMWVHDAASGAWIDARTAVYRVPPRPPAGMMYGVLAYAERATAAALPGPGRVAGFDDLVATPESWPP